MEKQEKQAIEILHMMCGNNGCVISDSGGKDSSVLKHIALKTKNMYGLARKIKRMSRKELDGYLTRVTDKSYNNGYEQGLVEGIALAGQAMDEILKEEVIKGTFPAEKVDEIKKAVGTYIAKVPEQAAEKDKDEGKEENV